jgi:riboflavin kinase / FMN adenylyltransferase
MNIYKNINDVKINTPFVTVGTFDGVHLGHQYIFEQLINEAKKHGGESVLITFWPHPRMVVKKAENNISMINTIEEKIELIEKQGIDHFIILPFTKEFSQLSSKEFIDKYLYQLIGIKGLIVGYDHKFGKDRQGNFEELKLCADKYGFRIKKIDALSVNNENISSTKIRNALLQGEIEKANEYLSRKFTLPGHVTNGRKIGRDLGFPTANIQPNSQYKLIPRDGVYAVKVEVETKIFNGMLNIGTRPTFNDGAINKSIEVHIIDFNGNLYHQDIKLYFHKRIRDEFKFNSIEELVSQLHKDKSDVIEYFAAK